MPGYWFAAKRYGWGWGLPLTWQGWMVYGVFMALIGYRVWRLETVDQSLASAMWFPGLGLALLIICVWKGEPARWRWGD